MGLLFIVNLLSLMVNYHFILLSYYTFIWIYNFKIRSIKLAYSVSLFSLLFSLSFKNPGLWVYYCGLQKFINTCIEKGSSLPFLCLSFPQIYNHHSANWSKINWMHFCYYQCLLPSICYQSCYINTFQTTLQLTLLILHMNEEVIWLRALTTHKSPSDTTQPKTRVSRYFPDADNSPWLAK